MQIDPAFPPHRRQDPKRRAELMVYEEIAKSPRPGRALYEIKTSPTVPELDFAVFLEDFGIVGLQVKGGLHRMERGQFKRITDDGPVNIADPIALTWDSAMQIRQVGKDMLNRKIFVIPMLLFPDMERDHAIEARAADAKVKVVFGTESLVERILSAFFDDDIFNPPSGYLIDELAEALLPYLADDDDGDGENPDPDLCNGVRGPRPQDPAPTGGPKAKPAPRAELAELPPVIGHADVVNIDTVNIYQGGPAPAGGVAPEEVPTD